MQKPKIRIWRKLDIVLLAGIFLVALFLVLGSSGGPYPLGKISQTEAEIAALGAASQSYLVDKGAFPSDLDNRGLLGALSGTAGSGHGQVYMIFKPNQTNSSDELVDSWGDPFRVTRVFNTEVEIESAGPDKVFGTADDISNR